MITLRHPRVLALSTSLAALAVTLTACSSGSNESLAEVWPETHQQLTDATSVRIQGDMGHEQTQATIDYAGQLDSSNYHSRLESPDGTTAEVMGTSDTLYGKFPDAVLNDMGPEGSVKAMLDGRWLEQPAQSIDLTVETMLKDGTANLPDQQWDGEDVEPEMVERFGRELHRYEDSVRGGALYLDPTDHSLAGLEHPGHESTVAIDLDFSQWDAVEPFDMPSDDDVVTQDELVALMLSNDK